MGRNAAITHPMRKKTDWPTLALIICCYVTWLVLLFTAPIWLSIPLLAPVIALQSSLQHEVLHGHPFRNQRINEALVWPSLNIVIPFTRFRDTHLAHHHDANLTDPYDDPESNYFDPEVWARLPRLLQLTLGWNNTLIGRMMFGPLISTIAFVRAEMHINSRKIALQWVGHLLAVAAVLTVVYISRTPLWAYAISAYFGLSILKIRTFLEHQASERSTGRTAIVECSGIFGFLFLNNNLHVIHHKHPRVAWYKLPALYRSNRDRYLHRNGGYFYPSYGAVFRAYAFRPKDPVAHPLFQKR